MAGLGECCSHVASVLWAFESAVCIRDSMTVTQKKAYWVIPNAVKEVPYAPVKSIDFVGKKKSFNTAIHYSSPTPSPSSLPSPSSSSTSLISSSTCSSSNSQTLQPPKDEKTKIFLLLWPLVQPGQLFYL